MIICNEGTPELPNLEERLERAERLLADTVESQNATSRILREMAARQQYHDEAHERHDAAIKKLQEMVMETSAAVNALLEIAEHHQRRLDDLENGQTT